MNDFIVALTFGCIAGFIPGMHPNFLSSLLKRQGFENVAISLAVGAFLPFSFLTSILLSTPQANAGATLLPLKRLVRSIGVKRTLSVLFTATPIAIILSIILTPVLLQHMFELNKHTLKLLITVLVLLSFKPWEWKALSRAFVFVAAGVLSMLSMRMVSDPFLVLFSGFFTIPMFFAKLSPPSTSPPHFSPKTIVMAAVVGYFLGLFSLFLPSISAPSQLISALLFPVAQQPLFYVTTSFAFLTSQYINAFFYAQQFHKARNGVMLVLGFKNLNLSLVAFLVAMIFALSVITAIPTRWFQAFSTFFHNVSSLFLFVYVLALTFWFGWQGLLVLIAASSLSILCETLGVGREYLMGSITLPYLVWFA